MNQKYFALAAVLILTAACGFHTKDDKEVTPVTPAEVPAPPPGPASSEAEKQADVNSRARQKDPEFKKALAAIEAGNYEMGEQTQAGSIVFSGILAKEVKDKKDVVVDKHVEINADSESNMVRTITEEELKVMNQVIDNKTYIDIGCGNKIPAGQIEGMTRVKARIQNGFMHVHANKVFMCGKGIVNQKNAVVYANEVIMKDTSFLFVKGSQVETKKDAESIQKDPVIINICAKTLTLSGENRLFSTERPKDGVEKPGSPIFLTVLDKVQGTGKLIVNQ